MILYNELNIKEAKVISTNINNLNDWDLNPLQNILLKLSLTHSIKRKNICVTHGK